MDAVSEDTWILLDAQNAQKASRGQHAQARWRARAHAQGRSAAESHAARAHTRTRAVHTCARTCSHTLMHASKLHSARARIAPSSQPQRRRRTAPHCRRYGGCRGGRVQVRRLPWRTRASPLNSWSCGCGRGMVVVVVAVAAAALVSVLLCTSLDASVERLRCPKAVDLHSP